MYLMEIGSGVSRALHGTPLLSPNCSNLYRYASAPLCDCREPAADHFQLLWTLKTLGSFTFIYALCKQVSKTYLPRSSADFVEHDSTFLGLLKGFAMGARTLWLAVTPVLTHDWLVGVVPLPSTAGSSYSPMAPTDPYPYPSTFLPACHEVDC